MAGITEKSNSGLFENEVEFNGKYATYVRFLKDDIGLFSTFVKRIPLPQLLDI